MGAPHPSKINHGYGPGGKTVRLAISTAVILKEEGCCRVKNSAVNCKSVERALFVFLFFFLVLFLFFFSFSFSFFCLFVCLFDFFNHLVQALNWFQKERTAKVNMVNKMKNKYLCWIVDNYAVCLSVIFIWNLFEVVGKVHVGPLILNFLFVCLFVFCFVLLFCFVLVFFLRQIQSQVACA